MSTVEFDEKPSNEADASKLETGEVSGVKAKGAVAADKRGNIYTMHAREGVNAAELINSALKKKTIGKVVPRRIEVIAPSGPSTSGGKRARQSITLVQVAGQGPAIMLGYLDVAQKVAQLRNYDLVAKQFQARFRKKLDISRDELEALFKDLSGMLGTLGFNIEKDEEDDALEEVGVSNGPSPATLALAAAVLIALTLGAAFLLR